MSKADHMSEKEKFAKRLEKEAHQQPPAVAEHRPRGLLLAMPSA
jgi:hypothetical protein